MQERLYPWLLASSSAALATGGVAMIILMLNVVVGPFRFGTLEHEEARRAVGMWVQPRPWGGDTRKRVEAWRAVVPGGEIVVEAESLPDLIEQGIRVVVVPDARRLSPEELAQALRFVREGGAIVLAGAVAVRDAAGEWRGFESMRALLETAPIRTLDGDAASRVTPIAPSVLGATLRRGEALPVRGEPGVPALDERGELEWGEGRSRLAAAKRMRLGRGKLLWLGPGPEAEIGGGDGPFRTLHRNGLAWARDLPLLETTSTHPGAVFARVELVTTRRALVRVTNAGEAPAAGVVLRVYLQRPLAEVSAGAVEILVDAPAVRFQAGGEWAELTLASLQPGVNRAFYLDFRPKEAPEKEAPEKEAPEIAPPVGVVAKPADESARGLEVHSTAGR